MVHINLQRNSQPSIYPFLPTIKHSWAWDYGRTGKYFKDKKSHYVEKDQWLIFEDTHAPIIDQEKVMKNDEYILDKQQQDIDKRMSSFL